MLGKMPTFQELLVGLHDGIANKSFGNQQKITGSMFPVKVGFHQINITLPHSSTISMNIEKA